MADKAKCEHITLDVHTFVCTIDNSQSVTNFEWDETKDAINIRKHGIAFAEVIDMFNHPMLTKIDLRKDYHEIRWVAIGKMKELFCVVVYTQRKNDVIRIISARKASRKEERGYEQSFKN